MSTEHPHKKHLLKCIALEIKEQEKRYKLDDSSSSLKQLKADGVALHPISVLRKSFGYADYPEITFKTPFAPDTSSFRESSAIECFIEGEEPVKGVFLGMVGSKGSFRLYSSDFPDWIEDQGVGIKLTPDQHTSEWMEKGIKQLADNPIIDNLFNSIHDGEPFGLFRQEELSLDYRNKQLNKSQKEAVDAIVENENLVVVHGPPGTGKTTTLVEGIIQLINNDKTILVTAPSNAAVDNIARGLIANEINVLRVGNSIKVDELVYPFTSEGKMRDSKEQKSIKRLKIQAEEFRKMAHQYKRRFGKEEREQRNLLIKEVRRIRKEIKEIRNYFDSKLYEKADVILGTPIGLANFLEPDAAFDTLVIDEAGQALEPLAWIVFPYAKSWVLAGDPFQLPPTVLSQEAIDKGFNVSLLEHCFKTCKNIHFLNVQYRMRKTIADFSSAYFYKGELQTPESQDVGADNIVFYDTAGTGYDEVTGKDGNSLMNEGEILIVKKILALEKINPSKTAFISPYSGQIQLAKASLPTEMRISTIDSFQGQEKEVVILSLVRSNPDAIIGFLKDYRRMNVAITRAKERLFIIGDSATIGQDPFFAFFLEYMEKVDGYLSAWEIID